MNGFFSADAVRRWRVLGEIEGWHTTKQWGPKSREAYAKLNPPFIPENEIMIFMAPILNPLVSGTRIYIRELTHQGNKISGGWLTATDSRLIYANDKIAIVVPVLYEQIVAVFTKRSTFTLSLTDGSQLALKMKIPGVDLLGAIVMIGGSPAGPAAATDEKKRQRLVASFESNFRGFFSEIADENKLRRLG
jgi:hypothetical protein